MIKLEQMQKLPGVLVCENEQPVFDPSELEITSIRRDQVAGTHFVKYDSDVDSLEIKHTAHSRKGFVIGALMAAEWLIGKKGCFGMKDMLYDNE